VVAPANDTSALAAEIQFGIHARMSGEQRLLLALDMSLFARKLAEQCIRQEHPGWTAREIGRELLRLAFLPEPLPAWLP